MSKCRHHYQWHDGKLKCARCGHRKWITHGSKRKIRNASICAILVIIGFLVYQNYDMIFNKVQTEMIARIDQSPYTKPLIAKITSLSANLSQVVTNSNVQLTPPPALEPKPVIDIPTLEQKIHLLIDVERQKNGISPLSLDQKLSTIARNHSIDMANRNYFEHNTPEGQDPTARGTAVGYSCHKDLPNGYYMDGLAENIYQNNLYNSYETMNGIIISHDWNDMNEIASSTVQGWMQSTGHRENILTSTFDREGIGVAISSDDKVYITEDFC